jgi:FixJ family two-component response regulator
MVTGSSDARIVAEAERQGVRAVLMKDHLDDTSLRDAIDSAIAAASRAVDQGRGESERMLSIAEARHGLAATFGVPPSNVEIIIHS